MNVMRVHVTMICISVGTRPRPRSTENAVEINSGRSTDGQKIKRSVDRFQ
jgi:hypothetical protein